MFVIIVSFSEQSNISVDFSFPRVNDKTYESDVKMFQ